jgi:hypothetical protein
MKKILQLLLCSMSLTCYAQYQDVIINASVVAVGSQECASRYEAILPLLRQYQRPITVLDVGASQGYFSFRIANEFDATCVMIEGNYFGSNGEQTADQLELLCQKNNQLKNIILLKKHISADELQILSECEHFDVVLALNVVHHFGPRWKQAVNALLNMGDHIIIETPPADDQTAAGSTFVGEILKYLQSQSGIVLGQFPRPTNPLLNDYMFHFSPMRHHLERIHWNNGLPKERWHDYYISSSFTEKTLYKRHEETTVPWVKGINLLTFKMLNGTYPNKETIYGLVNELSSIKHNDFKIWNLIIQGQAIVPIDAYSPLWEGKPYDFRGDFNAVLAAFRHRRS